MELSDITLKARWYHFISRLKENDFSLPNIEFNDITPELSDITLEYLGDITLKLSDITLEYIGDITFEYGDITLKLSDITLVFWVRWYHLEI